MKALTHNYTSIPPSICFQDRSQSHRSCKHQKGERVARYKAGMIAHLEGSEPRLSFVGTIGCRMDVREHDMHVRGLHGHKALRKAWYLSSGLWGIGPPFSFNGFSFDSAANLSSIPVLHRSTEATCHVVVGVNVAILAAEEGMCYCGPGIG